MPEFLIANDSELSKYARIEDEAIVWVEQSDATGFATPEQARERFDAVIDVLRVEGKKKGQAALERGTLKKQGGMFFKTKEPEKDDRMHRHRESHDKPEHFYMTVWLRNANKNLSKMFPVASRASRDDLLGVHELFYLCSKDGWLVRPQTRSSEGRLEFGPSFSMAVSFSSEASARLEMSKQRKLAWIVKSTCAFTQVIAPKDAGRGTSPELVGAISAACEARDIQGSIEASAQERLASMRGEAKMPPPRARSARL